MSAKTSEDELYYSNGGRGPNVARVINVSDGIVHLEVKANTGSKHWRSTTISEKFFFSPRCGWKKMNQKISSKTTAQNTR